VARPDRLRQRPAPFLAAAQASAVPRSIRPAAETAALPALVRGRRPGRSRGGGGCPVGAARMPGRDARLGMMSDGDLVQWLCGIAPEVVNRRRKMEISRFAESP